MFTVAKHRLYFSGLPVEYHPSPNYNKGRRIDPSLLVLHDTAGHGHGNDAISHFMKPSAQASCHLMIREDGSVVQFVDFDRRAWHCGRSKWNGKHDCNSWSLGIEMCNPGKLWGTVEAAYPISFRKRFSKEDFIVPIDSKMHGRPGGYWKPYTREQIETLLAVTQALGKAYPKIGEVVGHCQISPGRKVDPTPIMFEAHWPAIEAALVSCRDAAPLSEEALRYDAISLTSEDVTELQDRLNDLGFGPIIADGIAGTKTKAAVWAFQTENDLPATGELNASTVFALRSEMAVPAAIAGRQAVTENDLAAADPNVANAQTQSKIGQIQIGIAAIVGFLTLVADLGRAITSVTVSWGGELVLLIGCAGFAVFGLLQWRTAKTFVKRALGDWINGKSGTTGVPEVPSRQEG